MNKIKRFFSRYVIHIVIFCNCTFNIHIRISLHYINIWQSSFYYVTHCFEKDCLCSKHVIRIKHQNNFIIVDFYIDYTKKLLGGYFEKI